MSPLSLAGFLTASVAVGCCFITTASTISTVSQVRALSEDDYARGIPFSLTGLVTYSSQKSGLLRTADGNCALWSTNVTLRAGDIIRADGHTELNFFANDPILHTTNVVTLGTAPLPEAPLLSSSDLFLGKGDYQCVRLRGFITDAFNDQIDKSYVFALLNVDGHIIFIATRKKHDTLDNLKALVNVDIEITGVCAPRTGGQRLFGGINIRFDSVGTSIRIIGPAHEDPFAAPALKRLDRTQARNITTMKRRLIHGRVLATWQGKNVLVSHNERHIARIALAEGEIPPKTGEWIDAVGFPETDLFTINLSNALIRKAPQEPSDTDTHPAKVSVRQICQHPDKGPFNHAYYGKLVQLTGIVRSRTGSITEPGRIAIETDDGLAPIDSGNTPNAFEGIQIGSVIEATGICVMESENWRPQSVFPRITGFFVAIRTPSDIHVISTPSWWTPQRLIFVLAGLTLVIVTILIWNTVLRKLVERRSRELTRAQAAQIESEMRIDERTRIAAELHDYLAQNLTAVSYKLTTARAVRETDPESADAQLETAANMLDSSRTELRRCLWDLKSKALEEPTFSLAIRRSLQQITSAKNVDIAFDIPRTRISDQTAHAILSIIRELVSNAVNHGLADRIAISGTTEEKSLVISVTDNGYGFDPALAKMSNDGHFGLDGIRQRVGHLNGTFNIDSNPTKGTCATVRIPLHPHHGRTQCNENT